MIIFVDWIYNNNITSVEREGENFGRPKRDCLVHNNTEHHGTNINHLLSRSSVRGDVVI